MSLRTLVIGGGPAGLATAVALARAGGEVVCLESAPVAGGMLRTVRRDGFLAEEGPHSMRLSAGVARDFLRETGADATLVEADAGAAKKFITAGGLPVATPDSPWALATSPLLSLREKLRLAAEPFVCRRNVDTEETVADFVRRRLGAGAYAALVDAVVGGIYAGDGEALSVREAFPKLWKYEREHGSLVRGAWATRAARRTAGVPRVCAFSGGMADLASALAGALGTRLTTGATLTSLGRVGGGWRATWTIAEGGAGAGVFDTVVLATPAHRWGALPLPPSLTGMVAAGASIPHPPVAVVTLGYARERVGHALNGFGVLSPRRENRDALGAVFPGSIFAGRAPAGAVSLAVFIGGARRPELARLPAPELIALARRECESLLGARGTPEFIHAAVQPYAIPQYTLGHGERMAAIGVAEAAHPGLHVVGNFRGGPSLPAVLESGVALAGRIAAKA